MAKKFGCYNCVFVLNEFKTTLEDVLSKTLELYKFKHPNNVSLLAFVEGDASMVRFHGGKEDPPPKCKTLTKI